VKTEEVDAVLQREDLRLAVQPKAERLDVRLDLLEYLPEQQLVAVDDVEVVHVPAIYEAAVIPQPVVEGVQIEQREQLARWLPIGMPGSGVLSIMSHSSHSAKSISSGSFSHFRARRAVS